MTNQPAAATKPHTGRVERRLARMLFSLPIRTQLRLAGGRPITIDGCTLDPSLQLMLHLRRLKGLSGLGVAGSMSSAHARELISIDAQLMPAATAPMRSVRELEVAGLDGPIRARHYVPFASGFASARRPLVLFLHGGGWAVGDLDTHDVPCRLLAHEVEADVLSIDYRLAPEHPWSAAKGDALAAFAWARDHADELGIDPDRIAVCGDSAGGNLAAWISHERAARHEPGPAAQLLVYPSVGDPRDPLPSLELFAEEFLLTTSDMEWFVEQLLAQTAEEELAATVPLVGRKIPAGLPPTIVMTAGFDPLRDEGEAYVEQLRGCGIDATLLRCSDLIHGFLNMTAISRSAHAAVVDAADQLRGVLDRAAARAPQQLAS